MTDLQLHPTAATAIPYTICAPGARKAKATAKRPREMTCVDLRALVLARGLKATSAHNKAELRQMLTTGQYLRPAAYDRNNAARKAKRAAAAKEAQSR